MRRKSDKVLVAERVKALLDASKPRRTQVELAKYLDVDPGTMNRYLRNGMTCKDQLVKIGKYLNVNPLYLSGELNMPLDYSSYVDPDKSSYDCICDLLLSRGYSPLDFSKEDITSLSIGLVCTIETYAAGKNIKHDGMNHI